MWKNPSVKDFDLKNKRDEYNGHVHHMEHDINIWLQKEGASQLEWYPKGGSHCTNLEKKQPCAESPDKRENYVTWSCIFMESSSKHHYGRDIFCCCSNVSMLLLKMGVNVWVSIDKYIVLCIRDTYVE